MQGKLITDGKNNYSLLDYNNELLGTTMESMVTNQKLSLKNCEAIKNGYDLNELAKECQNILIKDNWRESQSQKIAFNLGFQKALEILGDKKFTYNDIRTAYMDGATNINCYGNPVINQEEDLQDTIKSIQQDEWDVEVVIEVINNGKGEDGLLHETVEPKLDENGCLILKRI